MVWAALPLSGRTGSTLHSNDNRSDRLRSLEQRAGHCRSRGSNRLTCDSPMDRSRLSAEQDGAACRASLGHRHYRWCDSQMGRCRLWELLGDKQRTETLKPLREPTQ